MRRSNRARAGAKRSRASSKSSKRAKGSNSKEAAKLAWEDAEITSEEEADPKVCLVSAALTANCDFPMR